MQAYGLFKAIILVMLFYSVGINIIVYTLPNDALADASVFKDTIDESGFNYDDIAADVQGGLDQQSNVPLIEIGALVFYSGNILVDLILNFVYAIPQMIGLLINAIVHVFGSTLDVYIMGIVEAFTAVALTVFYMLSLINLTTNIRSGRVI